MTKISGPLNLVTEREADVVEVWIRAPEPRPHNDGLIIDTTDRIEVTDGQMSFTCAPGPAILIVVTLVATGRMPSSQVPETRAVPILVPAAESVTLADVVNAATVSTLGQSLVEELAVRVANDLAAAQDAAVRAEAGAAVVGDAQTVLTARDEAVAAAAEAAQSAASGVQPDTVGRVHLTPALRGELDEALASAGTGASISLIESPAGSGLYTVPTAGLTPDPANDGLYLIGA